MGAREADSLDARDRVDRAQELCEARADVAAVGVDVLSEQGHLADSLFREPLDLRDDLSWPPRDLAAADGRNDAVRADGVAAHGDLNPRLETAFASHRKPRGKGAFLRSAERTARDTLAAGAEPRAEVRDRAGPKRDVDIRIEGEQPLPLRLGIAAADRDH